MVPITPLETASDVIDKLPLATITVLLLTATWSYEASYARASLSQAATLATCSSVAYYELSVEVTQLHASRPVQSPTFASSGRSAGTRNDRVTVAWNVTSEIPWFPCIRLYRKDGSYNTHKDSFDPEALANHIEQRCRQGSTHEMSSEHVEPSGLTRLKALTTPVSRDRFAQEVNNEVLNSLGILLLVPGGLDATSGGDEKRWNAIARAVSMENERKREGQDVRRRWVVSIVDSVKNSELADRNNAYGKAVIVLIDGGGDYSESFEVPEDIEWEDMSAVLKRFESELKQKRSDDRVVRPVIDTSMQVLSYLEEPREWRQHFSESSRVSLVAYLEKRFDEEAHGDDWIWLVVHQAWCGMSQRIVGSYRRLSRLAQERRTRSWVIEVSDMRTLPPFIDEMVDGFPTVIRIRLHDDRQMFAEYNGPHSSDKLMEFVEEKSWC